MDEPKNDNRVKHIEANPKITKSESHTDSFVNHDLTTSHMVDSAPKIEYHKKSPANLEDKVEKLDISERNNRKRKTKFTVEDQSKLTLV